MKVLISADMEGATGIICSDEMESGGREYERGRRFLTGDVNAAVEGAFEGGATEVLVNESHWTMNNIVTEDLDPRAELIRGSIKRGCMMEGLDESFSAVFLIGYHSKHGTPKGIMNHTMLGKEIQNFYLNGNPVGEMAINAAFAGQFGVPVAMVAGDQTLESEAKELLGDVETVVLKKGIGRFTAQLIHPRITSERLQQGATRAVQHAKQLKPYIVDSPSTLGIEFTSTAMAEVCSWIPTVERTHPRSIEFTFADWREGMGLMLTLLWLSLHVADHMY